MITIFLPTNLWQVVEPSIRLSSYSYQIYKCSAKEIEFVLSIGLKHVNVTVNLNNERSNDRESIRLLVLAIYFLILILIN